MSTTNPFSLDFLLQKPGKAARVIQTLDSRQAALYLSTVPVRVLAPVIERIESWPAARIIELMPTEQSSAVLCKVKFPAAAAVLRLVDDSTRNALLTNLPTQLTRTLSRSLNYPDDTVGAWMDRSAPHFSRDLSVAECVALLRQLNQTFELVVAVDDNHGIDGIIPVSALLISEPSRMLRELADRQCAHLVAQARLAKVKDVEEWQRFNTLPVRGRNGSFLGTLSRQTLYHALDKDSPAPSVPLRDSLLAHLSRAMMASVSGLLSILVNKRGRVSLGGDDNNELNH